MNTTSKKAEIKLIRIVLTDRPPVEVREDEWPLVAKARGDSFGVDGDENLRQQALHNGQCHSYALKVRKHKVGDWIVYGKRAGAYGSEDYNEGESLKSGADVSAAIRRTGKNCRMPDRIVRACIADLPAEQLETDAPALAATQRRNRLRQVDAAKKVFVVHGHDEAAREGTARFLEKLGLEPVILHEQPNIGRTIIEKFEQHGDVAFVVVLLTNDDSGCVRGNEAASRPRARQNVIFELGYFIGRLGRTHVAALVKGEIEKPSDYDGVVYISMDEAGGWRLQLAREIRAVGLKVDFGNLT
jgi:predicted nucleotide-binding protein